MDRRVKAVLQLSEPNDRVATQGCGGTPVAGMNLRGKLNVKLRRIPIEADPRKLDGQFIPPRDLPPKIFRRWRLLPSHLHLLNKRDAEAIPVR